MYYKGVFIPTNMTWFSGAAYWRIACRPPLNNVTSYPHSVCCAGRSATGDTTGDAMPQNGMNHEDRRGETCHIACEASSKVPDTDMVNGAIVHNGCPAAATRTSESIPAGTLNGTKPKHMVNGYVNHWYKGKSTKATPPRIPRKCGSTISALNDASAAGRGRSARPHGGIAINGATGPDTVSSPCNSDRMAPQPSRSAASRKPRRRKQFTLKKRDTEVVSPECPPLPPMPPQEEEDWDSEIQEVTLPDRKNSYFGISPCGPQDVLHFSLWDLTLRQTDRVDLPLTAHYSPAVHHRRPIKWTSYSPPTEPDQFADADE
ncbi:uncharacterized protein LOC121942088 isoform X2 [Plectropomus leopardus]|nr:uncharacterized protein LOC121942088 isoform X2 [Plectropomus leopardus]